MLQPTRTVLADDEPQPYELTERTGARPVIIVCDHASNRFPASLSNLGLAEHHLQDHIAWDIGAAGVAQRLAELLDASIVRAMYSRLVVDLNRALHDAGAFPQISDGLLVPGNLGLSIETKGQRARELFHPYHTAIRNLLKAKTTDEQWPVLIAIHSFTPRLHGVERPCHIGVLWETDPRLPLPLMRALRSGADIAVGDNEPYSGHHPADYTIDHHAERLGIAHSGIEIRQDLIRDDLGQERLATHLAEALSSVLSDDVFYDPPRSTSNGAPL